MLGEKIEEALQFVSTYAKEENRWRVIKKELLRALPIDERKKFSTRDSKTKFPNFNEFEKIVSERWFEITGSKVIITQE